MATLIKNGCPSFIHKLAKFVERYKSHLREEIPQDANIKENRCLLSIG